MTDTNEEALLTKAKQIVSMVLGSCALEGHIFDDAFRNKLLALTLEDLRKPVCR